MNPFQTEYPLSPRKFWKKLLPTLIPSIVTGFLLGAMVGIVPFALTAQQTGSVDMSFLGLGIGFGVLGALVIIASNVWYFKEYIRTYYYDCSQDFVTIRKRVFTPQEIHVQYGKIQDVYVDQDILDRIMGLYDVHIASATVSSAIEAHIDGVDVDVAERLKTFLLSRVSGSAVQQTAPSVPSESPSILTANFTGDISNTTYPIQGAWVLKSVLSSLVGNALLVTVLVGVFMAALAQKGAALEPSLLVWGGIGLYVLIVVVGLASLFIWKANYKFAFLPDYIQYRTGVLSISETHLPYKSIQDVRLDQDLIGRMLGLANVTIQNAAQGSLGSGSSLQLVGLTHADAQKITETIKTTVLSKGPSSMV